jgi:hypothetical protein
VGSHEPQNFSVIFERDVLVESLWEYGEDALAEAALGLSDADLREVQRLAAWHHANDPEPASGPRLTNARIMARAAIEFIDGVRRDTGRQRRRTRPRETGFLAP